MNPRSKRAALREQFRIEEIEALRPLFRAGQTVLDLGAGSGLQSRIISRWGCTVTALDVQSPAGEAHYPVQLYDGKHLPFADHSFDVVYSSNVLEHVRPVTPILQEIHRVVKPGGLCIHGIPSPSWRFWTSLTHYPFLAIYAVAALRKKPIDGGSVPTDIVAARGWGRALRNALIPPAHGEFPNALAELYYFSPRHWVRTFHRAGFKILEVRPNQMSYTGHTVAPLLPLRARRRLARFIGSSVNFYISVPE